MTAEIFKRRRLIRVPGYWQSKEEFSDGIWSSGKAKQMIWRWEREIREEQNWEQPINELRKKLKVEYEAVTLEGSEGSSCYDSDTIPTTFSFIFFLFGCFFCFFFLSSFNLFLQHSKAASFFGEKEIVWYFQVDIFFNL